MDVKCSSETSIDFQLAMRRYIQEGSIFITTDVRTSDSV
jgi:hypothetical protein